MNIDVNNGTEEPRDSGHRCPNCGAARTPYQTYCPNCGADRLPVNTGVWPPPVMGYVPPPQPPSILLTGSSVFDFIVGFVLTVMLSAPYCIGLIALPFIVIKFRHRYPYLIRGLVVGTGVIVLPILGLFLICGGAGLLSGLFHR